MSAAPVGGILSALFARGDLPLRVVSRASGPWTWQGTHYDARPVASFYAFPRRRGLRSGVFSADYTQPELFHDAPESRQSLVEQAKQQPQQPTLFGAAGLRLDAALFGTPKGAENLSSRARLFAQNRTSTNQNRRRRGAWRVAHRRVLHVSPNTVFNVRQREPAAVDIERKRLRIIERGCPHVRGRDTGNVGGSKAGSKK